MKMLEKKLVLKKTTIANLETELMNMVQGGRTDPETLPSGDTRCATFCYPWKCPPPADTQTCDAQFTCVTFFGC
ncbi:MAG: hypothetical protein GY757_11545 [bacterium]|nr:hypothetical protein [bacterium]